MRVFIEVTRVDSRETVDATVQAIANRHVESIEMIGTYESWNDITKKYSIDLEAENRYFNVIENLHFEDKEKLDTYLSSLTSRIPKFYGKRYFLGIVLIAESPEITESNVNANKTHDFTITVKEFPNRIINAKGRTEICEELESIIEYVKQMEVSDNDIQSVGRIDFFISESSSKHQQ